MPSCLSWVQLFVTLWTVAYQDPVSMGFSRQDTGVGYHVFLQGIFPTQGWNPHLLLLLYWQVDSLPALPNNLIADPFICLSRWAWVLGYLHAVQNGNSPRFLDAKAMCNSPNGITTGERFPTGCLKKSKWKWKSHGLYSPWNSPVQNTGVGSSSLLQGIFPTQGSYPGLPYGRQVLYQLNHKGSQWWVGIGVVLVAKRWNWHFKQRNFLFTFFYFRIREK